MTSDHQTESHSLQLSSEFFPSGLMLIGLFCHSLCVIIQGINSCEKINGIMQFI